MCNPVSVFNIGDRVKAKAFTDSLKKFHPELKCLVVKRVQICESEYLRPYFRIYAEHERHDAPINAFEASERFFAFEKEPTK